MVFRWLISLNPARWRRPYVERRNTSCGNEVDRTLLSKISLCAVPVGLSFIRTKAGQTRPEHLESDFLIVQYDLGHNV